MIYEVKAARIVRDSGILRVQPIDDGEHEHSKILYVIESPEKHLVFRTSRSIYDENDRRTGEVILVVEKPDFDIESILGMRLSSILQAEAAGQAT